ncbi:MAG: hypothetical protein WC375_01160 [Methanomassiliicoccales archaeon]|jgi:hypothetical protein
MIVELLETIMAGEFTLSDAGRKLGLGTDELKQRLDMMERMGYVERVGGSAPKCGEGPIPCSSCRSCKGGCCGPGKAKELNGYQLTEKGRRLVAKKDKSSS